MQLFLFHVNAKGQQGVASSEEEILLNKGIGWLFIWISVSFFSSSLLSLPDALMNNVGVRVAGKEIMLGSGKWRRSNSQLTGGRLITVGHFHHGRGSIKFLLEYVVTRILWIWISLPRVQRFCQCYHPWTCRIPYLPAMAFHVAWLLTKELSSQHMKWGNGPMFMKFTGLTMFPTVMQ